MPFRIPPSVCHQATGPSWLLFCLVQSGSWFPLSRLGESRYQESVILLVVRSEPLSSSFENEMIGEIGDWWVPKYGNVYGRLQRTFYSAWIMTTCSWRRERKRLGKSRWVSCLFLVRFFCQKVRSWASVAGRIVQRRGEVYLYEQDDYTGGAGDLFDRPPACLGACPTVDNWHSNTSASSTPPHV